MITMLKIFLGFKGTWFWACRQMMEGKTVYRFRDSGVVHFSYDTNSRRINAIVHWGKGTSSQWVSMEDVFATDFKLQHVCTPLKEGSTKSQTKQYNGAVDMGPAPKPIKPWGGEPLDTSKNAKP